MNGQRVWPVSIRRSQRTEAYAASVGRAVLMATSGGHGPWRRGREWPHDHVVSGPWGDPMKTVESRGGGSASAEGEKRRCLGVGRRMHDPSGGTGYGRFLLSDHCELLEADSSAEAAALASSIRAAHRVSSPPRAAARRDSSSAVEAGPSGDTIRPSRKMPVPARRALTATLAATNSQSESCHSCSRGESFLRKACHCVWAVSAV